MTDRQLTRNKARRQESVTADSHGAPDTGLAELRASADRLLGIADQAFEQIRAEDSREHVLRHRQSGGQ